MKLQVFLCFAVVLSMEIPGLTIPSAYKNLVEASKSNETTTNSNSAGTHTSSASTSIATSGPRSTNEKGGNESKNTDPKPSSSAASNSKPIIDTPSKSTVPPSSSSSRETKSSSSEQRPSSPITSTNGERESSSSSSTSVSSGSTISSTNGLKCRPLSNSGGRVAGISQATLGVQPTNGNIVIECVDPQGRIVRTTSDGSSIPISGSQTSGVLNGRGQGGIGNTRPAGQIQQGNGLGNIPIIDPNGQRIVNQGVTGQGIIPGQAVNGQGQGQIVVTGNPRGTIRQGINSNNVIQSQVIQSNNGGITIQAVGASDIRLGNVRVIVN